MSRIGQFKPDLILKLRISGPKQLLYRIFWVVHFNRCSLLVLFLDKTQSEHKYSISSQVGHLW